MPVNIEILDSNGTLDEHQTVLRQKEANGFELITFARSIISGLPRNTATFRMLDQIEDLEPLVLEGIPVSLTKPKLEARLNTGPNSAKPLLSFGTVFVEGSEANVAVYRE